MFVLRLLFLALFFAFTLLPVVGTRLGIAPPHGLFGAVREATPVALTAASYWKGEYQLALEQGFDASLGFRGQFVRADNELNLRAFRQVGANPKTSNVLGKDDFIFERDYVDDYNRHTETSLAELEAKVRRIALLQTFMQARGGLLLVVISPSKPLLYPEYLPPEIIVQERMSVPSNYEKFVSLLEKYAINTVDGQAYLAALKPKVPFTLFANGGTHWNDPAACEVSALVMEAIARKLDRPLPTLACKPYTMQETPREQDIDILRVCNLWDEARLYHPVPIARAGIVSRGPAVLPSFLIVGGSFNWAIMDYLKKFRAFDHTFFRYYSTEYVRGRRHKITPTQVDFEHSVFSKEVILLETNADVVQNVGWGFLEDAERAIQLAGK